MKISAVLVVLSAFCVSSLWVAANPVTTDTADAVCPGGTVVSTSFIGEHKNVKVEEISCPGQQRVRGRELAARQTNVCGATCNTNCFTPSGGGPDPNECHVISDALLFDSQNVGALFQIGTGSNNTIAMTFRSCLSFFANQDVGPLVYCRTDWAAVLDFVAFNCQATQNAHGGNCVASNQEWFIQVQHS